jgi:uncharacterized protein
MSLKSVFSFLLPKRSAFFPLFSQQSAILIKASEELVAFCKETDKEKQKEIYKTISKLEKNLDAVTQTIIDELNNTFITPFDREDIRELADHMDDVVDFIKSATKRTIIYQPNVLHPSALEISLTIQSACLKIEKAILGLEKINKTSKETMELCKDIKHLEHNGDDSYEEFLNQCFKNEKDAIEIIKQTQVMKVLEQTTNATNEVAKVIKTILIKYA